MSEIYCSTCSEYKNGGVVVCDECFDDECEQEDENIKESLKMREENKRAIELIKGIKTVGLNCHTERKIDEFLDSISSTQTVKD